MELTEFSRQTFTVSHAVIDALSDRAPSETTIFPPDVTIPPQIASGCRRRSPAQIEAGFDYRIDRVNNPVTTRKHVFKSAPSSANFFRRLPSEGAIVASRVTIPPQIASVFGDGSFRYPYTGLYGWRDCIDDAFGVLRRF